MKSRKMIHGLASGLSCAAVLMAGSVNSADLADIYQQALQQDPVLRSAQYEHQAASEAVPQARADYLPQIVYDYDDIRTQQKIISSDNQVFQRGDTSFPTRSKGLTVTQPVFRYANYLRMDQADEEVVQADMELISARQELILRTSEAYLQVLTAQDEISYLEAERQAVAKQLEQAEGREQAKVGRAVDRLDAEARLASVEAELAGAEIALNDAYQAIFEITGDRPDFLEPLTENFKLIAPVPESHKHWLDTALADNLGIRVQQQAMEVARIEVQRQQAGHYPTVDAVYKNTERKTGGTLFGGGSNVRTEEFMLRFNLPIYLGGSVSSRKREAVAKYHSEQENLTRIKREVQRESLDAYWGVVNSIRQVRALEKAVTAQQETLTLKRASFESGLVTAINVLDAERDLFSVRRDLSKAKYDYLLNSLRLKEAAGILQVADINLINSWLSSGNS
ncbi:TolC family outer membrane protein [Spongorhabdus nitratireducens]